VAKAGGFIPFSFVKKTATAADSNFSNVVLLLNGEGSSSGQQNNNFVDSSSTNVTITRNGDVSQGSFTPFGKSWSYYFDGSGDYLSIPATSGFDFSAGTFTLEFWVYLNTRSGETVRTLMFGSNNTSNAFCLAINSNGTVDTGRPLMGSTGVATTSTISVGTWTHVAFVHNGSTGAIYLNGLKGSTDVAVTLPTAGSIGLTVGFDTTTVAGWGVTGYLNGYMSSLRITKGVAKYSSNFTPSKSPLTADTGTTLLTCQSNRFVDNSTNNLTISIVGDVKVVKESPFPEAYDKTIHGASCYFDGSGDYLTIPSNTWNFGAGNFTVEAWVYPQTTGASLQVIGGHNYGTDCSWLLWFSTTSISFGWNTSSNISITCSIPLNSWNHLVVVRDSATLRYFVNGIQVGTGSISGGITTDSRLISIGADFDGNGSVYTGYYSNIRVYNTTAVYTSNFTIPTAPSSAGSGICFLMRNETAAIIDLAGKNNLQTVGNAQVGVTQIKYGSGSLYFDGTGDFLSVPANTPAFALGTGDFTLECWVYHINRNPTWGSHIIGPHSYGVAADWFLSIATSGLLFFQIGSTTTYSVTSSATVPVNTWTHICVVRNSGTVTMYINGTSVGSASMNVAITDSTYPLTIGAACNSGATLTGYLDDLRLTKGIARYTANFTPPTATLPVKAN
jgi:hypothetical protein